MNYREIMALLVSQRERAIALIDKHDAGITELQEHLTRAETSRDGLLRLLEGIERDIVKVMGKMLPADKELSS